MNKGQFKPGNTPWNKGKKFNCGGRSIETHFKPGSIPPNCKPVGTLRINPDGHLLIKTENGRHKWKRLAHVTWRQHHGSYPPPGTVIILKNGQHTDPASNQDINNLLLLKRGQLMQQNSRHNLPEPIKELMTIKAQITRQINKTQKRTQK